jgi:hypothetical protein
MQHAVFMGRAGDLDMVGQLEPLFEPALGDAAMQEGPFAAILGLAGRHEKRVVAQFDGQFIGGEAGDGQRDAIGVLVGLFDVERRVAGLAHILAEHPVQQIGKLVEADRGTVKRGQVDRTHCHPPSKRCHGPPDAAGPCGFAAGAVMAPGSADMGMAFGGSRPRCPPCRKAGRPAQSDGHEGSPAARFPFPGRYDPARAGRGARRTIWRDRSRRIGPPSIVSSTETSMGVCHVLHSQRRRP